tara:strand:+ start:1702 stop:2238 length:537 start_codon:yes stop_codon:yes gene_type:complete
MILGLDVSTSFVGVTALNLSGELIFCEAIDLRKIKNYFQKAEKVKKYLQGVEKKSPYWVKKVYIEQSLQAFRPGFSSANTLMTLAKFNGTVSWLCYDIYSLEAEYINASSARASCGIKTPRGKKAKEIVLQYLLDTEPYFDVQYTLYDNPKPGSYDRADSLVIAKAGYKKWTQESSES